VKERVILQGCQSFGLSSRAESIIIGSVQRKVFWTPSATDFPRVQTRCHRILLKDKIQNLLEPRKILQTFLFFVEHWWYVRYSLFQHFLFSFFSFLRNICIWRPHISERSVWILESLTFRLLFAQVCSFWNPDLFVYLDVLPVITKSFLGKFLLIL
jgi:hypothetical protein